MDAHGRHEAAEPPPTGEEPRPRTEPAPPGFWAEVHDAVAPRTVGLVFGVLLLQLGFILSYLGAFHAPKPHRIPVAVVAPASVSGRLIAQLNRLPGEPVHASAVRDEAAGRARLATTATSAVLLVDPAGPRDTLLVASGGGTSVSGAVEQVAQRAEAGQRRTLAVSDVIPLRPGDGRGLSGFYLVVGWIVGGYLVAALLGVAKGARPATTRRAVIRLLSVVPYAVVSGLGGALIVDPLLAALPGHFVPLWALGALVVFAAAAVTMAFQVLFGVVGIALTVLLFVVLGNPSAGGAYQPALLPPFWRALSGALPNGAATDTVRRIVYFGAHGIGTHLIVLGAYAAGGVLVALLASTVNDRRQSAALTSR